MQGAHKINYEVYCSKHEVRMRVERRREENHLQSQRLEATLYRNFLHGGI